GATGAVVLVLAALLIYFYIWPGQERGQESIGANPEEANYEGVHDRTDNNRTNGWAWDKNRPDTTISVDIYDGETLLATVKAENMRPDIARAGKGNGKHGFNYPTPASLRDGKPHSIRVRFSGTKKDLRKTPQTFTFSPE